MTGEMRQYDRRRHARIVKDLFTVYTIAAPFEEGLFTTKNVSGAGILFRSSGSLKMGVLLNLNIHLPDRVNPIPCEAKVVRTCTTEGRSPSFDIGVAFTKITEADKKQLIGSLLTQDDLYLFL